MYPGYLNWVLKPRNICHFGHPAPLSSINTCGSRNTLKAISSQGIT